MKKITEQSGPHRNLENQDTRTLLTWINDMDATITDVIRESIPRIEPLVDAIVGKMQDGGRLFYIGAGTSGRLGILDASECPPTFGVDENWVIGLIAGGDGAIRKAVEFAEDSTTLAWEDLSKYHINDQDVVLGIAASGTTPYVVHGLKACREKGITTGCITCNPDSPLAEQADFPIEVITGPEFVTGSTRMKAGTAQKLVLNMISTTVMIRLGRVRDNKMVDMQLSNNKLMDRGTRLLVHALGLDYNSAKELLLREGSVRKAMDTFDSNNK